MVREKQIPCGNDRQEKQEQEQLQGQKQPQVLRLRCASLRFAQDDGFVVGIEDSFVVGIETALWWG